MPVKFACNSCTYPNQLRLIETASQVCVCVCELCVCVCCIIMRILRCGYPVPINTTTPTLFVPHSGHQRHVSVSVCVSVCVRTEPTHSHAWRTHRVCHVPCSTTHMRAHKCRNRMYFRTAATARERFDLFDRFSANFSRLGGATLQTQVENLF